MENTFIDKFSMVAAKIGAQVHLRSLRDGFAMIMPLFILAGVAVLINNVVLPWFFAAGSDELWQAQYWGRMITNGTLNISSLLVAPMIGYFLASNKGFETPISAVVVAIAVLITMMPFYAMVTPVGLSAAEAVEVMNVLRFPDLGTHGMFAGIILGLTGTELFMKLSSIKRLQISLGDDVPPAVAKSFTVLIPVILTMSLFALLSMLLLTVFDTNLIVLITNWIQEPLRGIGTGLWGAVLIYAIGNFLFTMGIHQAIVNNSILMPLAMININENMLAFQQGQEIPHIITWAFIPTFGMMGGTGSTLALLIAIFLFARQKSSKNLAKMAVAPGVFNINEPVIFGYPIVFNLPLMIPFTLLPAMGIIIAYAATALGFMNRTVVMIPWTTPPLLSGFLATGGDWRAVVVQLLILAIGVFLYLPFIKISEKVASQMNEANPSATEEGVS